MIYDHIFAYFAYFCPCSTNLVVLVQATISKYYMCKVWKLSNEYFCMTSISNVLVFLSFVYNPMSTSPTSASSTGSTTTTIYILMHNFNISYRAGFNPSLLKRAKIIFIMIPNIPWYLNNFRVKRNYIVIFEESCNSSTLLMVLFMICGQLRYDTNKLTQLGLFKSLVINNKAFVIYFVIHKRVFTPPRLE